MTLNNISMSFIHTAPSSYTEQHHHYPTLSSQHLTTTTTTISLLSTYMRKSQRRIQRHYSSHITALFTLLIFISFLLIVHINPSTCSTSTGSSSSSSVSLHHIEASSLSSLSSSIAAPISYDDGSSPSSSTNHVIRRNHIMITNHNDEDDDDDKDNNNKNNNKNNNISIEKVFNENNVYATNSRSIQNKNTNMNMNNNNINHLSFMVNGIPANISNVYRGRWNGYIYRNPDQKWNNNKSTLFPNRRKQSRNQNLMMRGEGEVSMKLKCTETILKEYLFVNGDVHLRYGVHIQNRYHHLLLEGVYDIFTNVMYFYLRPTSMLNVQLQGDRALFNDTGARLAYELAMQHKSEEKKMRERDTFDSSDPDPDNSCIFKGMIAVSKKADMTEQEEQFRSFKNLSPEDKLRRSIFLNLDGELTGLNCNSTIHISESTFSVETFYEKAVHYSVMANLITFLQIIALIYQMNFTSTQSGAARVSLYTVAQQAMIDSYLTLLHLTIGIFMDGVFDAYTVTTFLSFVLFSIFEMRYLLSVWKATRPDDSANGWNNMRHELQKLYFRFYGTVFLGMFLVYHYPVLFKYALFALHSFWLPQIVTNVLRSSRTSVHPFYVVVISVTRMVIPCYFFLCPRNFVSVETNPRLCMWLGIWLAAQSSVLILQHMYGPRWFIPKLFEPKKYNYYRSIPQELLGDEECTCVICMHPIVIPERNTAIEMEGDDDSDSESITMNLAQASLSAIEEGEKPVVTRCSHIFHEACLQRWMAYSTLCPTCRAPLDDGL